MRFYSQGNLLPQLTEQLRSIKSIWKHSTSNMESSRWLHFLFLLLLLLRLALTQQWGFFLLLLHWRLLLLPQLRQHLQYQ